MGIGGPTTSLLSILYQHKKLDGFNSVIEIGAQELNEDHISLVLDFPHEVPRTLRELSVEEKKNAKTMLPQQMYEKIGIINLILIQISFLIGQGGSILKNLNVR